MHTICAADHAVAPRFCQLAMNPCWIRDDTRRMHRSDPARCKEALEGNGTAGAALTDHDGVYPERAILDSAGWPSDV